MFLEMQRLLMTVDVINIIIASTLQSVPAIHD